MADLLEVLHEIRDVLNNHFEATEQEHRAVVEYDQIQTPMAIIEPHSVDWTESPMNRGIEKWDIVIRFLFSTTNRENSILSKISFFGTAQDIKDQLESATSLRDGTVADDIFVRTAQNFGVWIYNDLAYEGVEFSLDVYA